jgi:hypothetical protein
MIADRVEIIAPADEALSEFCRLEKKAEALLEGLAL